MIITDRFGRVLARAGTYCAPFVPPTRLDFNQAHGTSGEGMGPAPQYDR